MKHKYLIYRTTLSLFSLSFILTACGEEEDPNQAFNERLEEQVEQIETYLADNNIDATAENGYYLEVITANPDGAQPLADEALSLYYELQTLDGELIDRVSRADGDEAVLVPFSSDRIVLPLALHDVLSSMRVGEEVRAYLPFDRAYVTYELPNVFPAYSAFILQLELANALDSLTLSRQQDERIKAYLAENELLPADSLQGGVYYHRTEEGEAPEVGPDNTARVRYTGRLLDGTTFDSNTDAPNPLRVNMSERAFIPGFMSGIGAMSQQERGTVVLPYHQGYGANFYVMPFSIMNDLISEGIVPSSASLGTYAPLRFDLFVEAVN